jgi:two-component sensor histidine kinase
MSLANALTSGWRAWWSPSWHRERGQHPLWTQLLFTALFNTAIAVGITLVAWGFARRPMPGSMIGEAFLQNLLISQCIGFTIHVMYALGARLIGSDRMDAFTMPQRVVFYAGIPIFGVLLGYAISLTLLGVNVVQLVAQRPTLPLTILLLSLLMSAFWYRHMANRSRLAEAEAEQARAGARAAELERQALDARLRSLQAQIEPHFLFNTLANVVSLIDAQPADAKRMLERLIDLLRGSLSASRAQHATLGQEADLLRAYLDILAIRMAHRLRYEIDIDASLRAQPLAPMLLQPLVENAIQHGLEPKIEGGRVRITARERGADLEVVVEDDGVGFGATTRGGGVGLSNLRERLAALYGARARLAIEDARPGTRARLTLPLDVVTTAAAAGDASTAPLAPDPVAPDPVARETV